MANQTFENLKKRFGCETAWDFWAVMLIFSLAGLNVSFLRKPIFALIGVTSQTPLIYKILIYVPLILPLYQVSLLFYALLFGKFQYFLQRQKRVVAFLLGPILRNR